MFVSIKNKFFISFSLLGLIALAVCFSFIYHSAKQDLQQTFKSELKNSTELISNLVDSVARASIENHLRAIADTQLSVIAQFYDEYLLGHYSQEQAKDLAKMFLLRQHIATTGYSYCLNSNGDVVLHPDPQLQGQNVADYDFVQEQLHLKNGYLEYRWRNNGETQFREKVLYMRYFPDWDWIISVSAYKSEFAYLIDFTHIRTALDKISFGDSGYPFIVSSSGVFLYHPQLTGSLYDGGLNREYVDTVEELFMRKNGSLTYHWKNPGETQAREKIAVFSYLDSFSWYVGTSAYLDELYHPLNKIRRTFVLMFLVYGTLSLLVSYGLSSLITRPLKNLVKHFRGKRPTSVELLDMPCSRDEIGMLGSCLNDFIRQLQEEIAEREQSAKALRTSEQTFNTLFNQSFQFIALLDPAGRVVKINETALKFRNLKNEQIVGQLFWETPWWSHSATLIKQLQEAFAVARQGQMARFEVFSDNVRTLWLDISIKPVCNDEGEILFLIAEARDVTDIKRAEMELQQVQKMESVGTLAGGIAHDFNNALAGILGSLTLLQLKRNKGPGLTDDFLAKHLEMMSRSAQRAKNIVNQLLTLSRKYDFEMVPLDMHEVLERVCQLATTTFDKSIRIETQIEGHVPVLADGNSLEQVFLNLCINAAHAMTIMRPDGLGWGGILQLSLHQTEECERLDGSAAGHYWCVCISDTGVGIDQESLAKVFVPFYTTKEKGTGSGLGLAMAYHIVRQHHGFMEVASEVGHGTTVKVFLPVSQLETPAQENGANQQLETGRGVVLVVDDEESLRENARECLEECGYEVLTAHNGLAGIELFRRYCKRIDVVLLDLVMPVLSGNETYLRLKEIDPGVRVLLSSGFRHDSRVNEIMASGANGFIQKPYDLYELARELKGIIAAR